jgi:transposase
MGAANKFVVRLTAEQRQLLDCIVRNGASKAKRILHARILLMSDADHVEGRWKDVEIAKAVGVHENTVARVRIRFVTGGLEPALERKPRLTPPNPPKFDGRQEAQLIAMCCSAAPAGRVRWTLSLLVDELKRRRIVSTVCRETVRRTLKKTGCNLGESNGSASPRPIKRALSRRWKKSSTCTRPSTLLTSR